MSERITILWNKPRPILSRAERDAGHRAIVDLQIDRAFRLICPDTIVREAFLSVLLTPLTDIDEINARRQVIEKFIESPALLERLTELVRRLLLTKKSWDSERSRLLSSRNVNPSDKSLVLWNSRGALVLTANFTRVVVGYVREIHESLNMFGVTDGWLADFKERVYRMACTREIEEILKFADHIERNLANAHTYDVEFELDDELRMSPMFLRGFEFVKTVEKQAKKVKNPLLALIERSEKKSEAKGEETAAKSEDVPQTALGSMDSDWCLETCAKAVRETDRWLTSFVRGIIDALSGLEDELYFYKAVLMHIDRLTERRVGLIYPKLLPAEENTVVMSDLSDLLLTESMSVQSVVPNDVNIRYFGNGVSGTLVRGRNNSGKTVYLRSVGTAVLLAQCGLPIPAKEAEISVRSGIFTTFAKAEAELEPLSSAGRFEEEVAELARIIERVEPNSLLLMNETFQTTAYDEGAEGISHILKYLSSLGCAVVFVTHLTKLCEMYADEEGVAVMHTSEDARTRYKIFRE